MDLVRLDRSPVPSVVELLEDLLERARRGEVIGVAVAAACSERCDASTYAIGEGTVAQLVLSIERVKLRLLEHRE